MRGCGWAVAIAGVILLIIVVAGGMFLTRPVAPVRIPPPPPLPADNAFDDCQRAVSLLVDAKSPLVESPQSDLASAETLLAQNRPALDIVRKAFSKEYVTPRTPSALDMYPYLPGYKGIARLFLMEARLRELKGDYPAAAESVMDARRFGARIPEGGDVIHRLVGAAITSIAYNALEGLVGKLDKPTCRRLLRELEEADADEPPLAETFSAEEIHTLRVMQETVDKAPAGETGWEPGRRALANLTGYQDAATKIPAYYRLCTEESEKPHYLRKPVEPPGGGPLTKLLSADISGIFERQARAANLGNQLRIRLALRIYKLDRGTYPRTLSELAPKYLEHIPIDELSGKTFRYTPSAGDYVLSSSAPAKK